MTNIPPEIMEAVGFIQNEEDHKKILEAKKELVRSWIKQNGTILDQEKNVKVMLVVRQLTSLNKDEMTDYRKDKVIAGMKINRANVLDYAKSSDLKKAGYTAETAPELFTIKESESVKITAIPKGERE